MPQNSPIEDWTSYPVKRSQKFPSFANKGLKCAKCFGAREQCIFKICSFMIIRKWSILSITSKFFRTSPIMIFWLKIFRILKIFRTFICRMMVWYFWISRNFRNSRNSWLSWILKILVESFVSYIGLEIGINLFLEHDWSKSVILN